MDLSIYDNSPSFKYIETEELENIPVIAIENQCG